MNKKKAIESMLAGFTVAAIGEHSEIIAVCRYSEEGIFQWRHVDYKNGFLRFDINNLTAYRFQNYCSPKRH